MEVKHYNLKPVLPVAVVLLLYLLFMPTYGVGFFDLERHQQAIALSSTPTFMLSLYWFVKVNRPVLVENE